MMRSERRLTVRNTMNLPPSHLRHYQRPENMDDPLRPLWFRIHRDDQYAPSNVEARLLGQRLKEAERERNRMEGALRFILLDAEAWHRDNAGRGRALSVIAAVAKDAIPD